jgi:hypothetical protein
MAVYVAESDSLHAFCDTVYRLRYEISRNPDPSLTHPCLFYNAGVHVVCCRQVSC